VNVNESIVKLKDNLVDRDKAYALLTPFDGCVEEEFGGGQNLSFRPKEDDVVVLLKGSKEYSLEKPSLVKLSRLVGIPESYVEKIPVDLLFPHLSYWLKDKEVVVKGLLKGKDSDGRDRICGFLKENAEYYPATNVLRQADKIGTDYFLEGAEDISWRSGTFGLVFPKYEFDVSQEIGVNDYIYGGVKIRLSMFGEQAFKISAFLLTLICMNGMVSYKDIFTFNRHRATVGMDEFVYDGLNASLSALSKQVDSVRTLKNIALDSEHIVPYVEAMFDKIGIHQRTRVGVLEAIVSKSPKTMYELMNAITAAAHTVENRNDVFNLQLLGGFVVDHAERCGSCHRPF